MSALLHALALNSFAFRLSLSFSLSRLTLLMLLPLSTALAVPALQQLLTDKPERVKLTEPWYNDTPLHLAVWSGRLEAVRYLLQKGANVDAVDKKGDTPLHLAAWLPLDIEPRARAAAADVFASIVELLLKNGANASMKNEFELTPHDEAKSRMNHAALKHLALPPSAPPSPPMGAVSAPQPPLLELPLEVLPILTSSASCHPQLAPAPLTLLPPPPPSPPPSPPARGSTRRSPRVAPSKMTQALEAPVGDSIQVEVAVRVRPFNEREKSLGERCVVKMDGRRTLLFDPMRIDVDDDDPSVKTFSFDKSYWSFDGFQEVDGINEPTDDRYASQQALFDDFGKTVLESAWEGKNSCLFAYGQTGSGKSYSVVGYGKNEGIVPHVAREL